MPQTVANAVSLASVLRADPRVIRAKGAVKSVPKADQPSDVAVKVGAAVHRARIRADWNLQEFAREMKRNERLIAKWETGEKNPNLEAMLGHALLRGHFIIALAELFSSDSIEVETTVRIRRRL